MNGVKPNQGDAYSRDVESTEFWERQWDAQQRGMQGPAAMFLLVLVALLGLGSTGIPPIAPVLVGVIAIWLMMGRGNVLVRCLVTVAMVWILGSVVGRGGFMAVLVLSTMMSAVAIWIAGLIMSHLSHAPTRRAQFSL